MRIKKLKIPKWMKSVKCILGAVNCLFLITGLILIVTGVVVVNIFSQYELFLTNRFYAINKFVIATGTIILLVSILGFYGAVSQKFYFIAGYLALCLSVLIFNMSIGIAGSKLREDVKTEIRGPMAQSLQLYRERSEHTKAWDDMQMEFECCGVTGRNDWRASAIPVSCCHIDYGTVSPFICEEGQAYTTGCLTQLGDWLAQAVNVAAVVGLVTTGLQVFITALAGWMAWRSKFEEVELES